jgi:hypothetical protein
MKSRSVPFHAAQMMNGLWDEIRIWLGTSGSDAFEAAIIAV